MKLYEKAIKQLERDKPKVTIEDNTAKRIEILNKLLQAEYGFIEQNKDEVTKELKGRFKETLINEVLEEIKNHSNTGKTPYYVGLQIASDTVQKRKGKQQ